MIFYFNVEIHIRIHFQLLFFFCFFLLVLYKSILIVICIHKHNFLSLSAVFGGMASIIGEKMAIRVTDGGPYW